MRKQGCDAGLKSALAAAVRLQPEETEAWGKLLPLMAIAVGAKAAVLSISRVPGAAPVVPDGCLSYMPKELHERYLCEIGSDAHVAAAIGRLTACGTRRVISDGDAREILGESRYSQISQLFQKLGFSNFAVLPLWQAARRNIVISVLYDDAHGAITDAERERLNELGNICREAMLETDVLHREEASAIAASFSGMPIAAFVTNGFGEVIAMSDEAQKLIESGDIVRLNDGGLECANPADTKRLHTAFERSYRNGRHSVETSDARSGQEMAKLVLARLTSSNTTLGFSSRMLIMVKMQMPPKKLLISPAFKGDALTRAEFAVAEQLANGKRIGEIAKMRRVSIETIRSQIKAIYGKLKVRNQIELMKAMQVAA